MTDFELVVYIAMCVIACIALCAVGEKENTK